MKPTLQEAAHDKAGNDVVARWWVRGSKEPFVWTHLRPRESVYNEIFGFLVRYLASAWPNDAT